MRKLLLIAGVAALAIPGLASAQPGCRAEQHDNRVAGTVLGAAGGALLGGAISGRAGGAIVGGVAGGALGNVVGGASTNCVDYPRTGHYDANGVWHQASGYYDADGNWVDTRPPAVDYGYAPNPNDYNADVAYTGARDDINSREIWIDQRIREGDSSGAIAPSDAHADQRRLARIRDDQAEMATDHDGLTADDRDNLSSQLDDLGNDVRGQWRY
jgi:hypothetical protein